MPAQQFAFGIVVDAYGGVHECTAGADGTLAPAEVARLRAVQLDAQRRSAAHVHVVSVERERGEAWWRERFAPGNPARLAGIDA